VKKIAVVPTLLTLGNGVCGFTAITLASKINPVESPAACDFYLATAGWFIVAAMVFDMFDGYVARLSRTASKFGGELDSLCDAVSFGVAPAFLLLKIGPGWEVSRALHQLLAGIAALFMVCALLRLARFNVDNTPDAASHKRFRGLPSPGAAGCLASLAILRGGFPEHLAQIWTGVDPEPARQALIRVVEVFAPIGALVIALLMVSSVPYPHVTKQIFRGRRTLSHLIQVLLGVFIILLMRELSLLIIFWVYALAMPIRHALMKNLRRDSLPTPDPLHR
jgi:CDP-diacylglycerol--serine O-phosphatidyltransferase